MYAIRDIKNYDIRGDGLPAKVETVAYVAHMAPLIAAENYINEKYNCDIKLYVSLKSSYRNTAWEKSKGRSGYSEHTYNFLGACDITCDNFKENQAILLEALIAVTRYTRLAIYNAFIHGDYKNAQSDAYVYNSSWVRQYPIKRAA